MWTKTIIVDKTVKVQGRRFSYGFTGFAEDGTPGWNKLAEAVKLYDNVADAVADATKLQEELPVEVVTFGISLEGPTVTVTTVKF